MGEPFEDFAQWEMYQLEWLNGLPRCSICGQPIQDEYYYEMGDELICESCMDDYKVANEYL